MQSNTIKTIFAVLASTATVLVSSYSLSDKIGFKWTRPVLTWAPEHFIITGAPVNEPFTAVVAREKHRDDCEVTGFTITIKDSNLRVFHATPATATFSGPASDTIDKFAYEFYIMEQDYDKIATGEATFMGTIVYSCPEGVQRISYPPNLKFIIQEFNGRPD